MEYGIQRRTIYLVPPGAEDLAWIFGAFDDPEIYGSLGLLQPAGAELRKRHAAGDHVFGVVRSVETRARIGFVVVFPPSAAFDAWSFAYAITELAERNAFNALNTTDAMAHYLFEHLRVDAVGWETREGNGAAEAIVRRLGYRAGESRIFEGRRFVFYRIDREAWMRRRAKLDEGERRHPSGTGGTFVKLVPPYYPVVPRRA